MMEGHEDQAPDLGIAAYQEFQTFCQSSGLSGSVRHIAGRSVGDRSIISYILNYGGRPLQGTLISEGAAQSPNPDQILLRRFRVLHDLAKIRSSSQEPVSAHVIEAASIAKL